MSGASEASSLIVKAREFTPLLGFGLFVTSLPFLPPQLSYLGGLLFSEGSQSLVVAGALAGVMTGIICALASLHQSVGHKGSARAVLRLCLIGYPFAIAALFASPFLGGAAASVCSNIASVLASGLAFPLAIAWLNMFADLPLKQAAQSLCISIALASALNILAIMHLLPYLPLIGVAFAVISILGLIFAQTERKSPVEKCSEKGAVEHCAPAISSSDLLTRSMLPTVLAMCFGLFLAVFSMTGRLDAYIQATMPVLYFNIDATSPLAAAIILFAFFQLRSRIGLAEIAYFYIPFCAVFFFVATTFSAETPLFDLGFAGSTVLLMIIGLLALGALPGIVQAGEIPPRLICAVVFGGCSLASLLGFELPSAVSTQELGPFLLLAATVYFVTIISIALIHKKHLIGDLDENEPPCKESARQPSRNSALQNIASAFGLTEREREVLGYVAAGHNSPYIAERLFISEYTVRTHMRNIYRKIGVESKEGLVRFIEDYRCS